MMVLTISAMGKKCVVLGLAMCFVLSSFHEVSCQVGVSWESETFKGQEFQSDVKTLEKKATSSVSQSVETESEASSVHEVGQSSSVSDEVRRLMQGYNKQAGSDGVQKDAELMDASEDGEKKRNQPVEELQRQVKAAAASSQRFVQEEIAKEKSQLETCETTFQDVGRSLNQDKNVVKEQEDASMAIQKYSLDDIIKEGSTYQDAGPKTSSLIKTLIQIIETHKKKILSRGVTAESSSTKTSETVHDLVTRSDDIVNEKSTYQGTVSKTIETPSNDSFMLESVEELKVTLKSYGAISAKELMSRSDVEEILKMAARYEELSSASVSYIPRLSTYGTVIRKGFRASQRVETAHQRVRLHQHLATEKQKRADAEFELAKALAQKGDKLDAEKKEVEMEFQKIAENLSRVLEESSQAYEKYRVVVRKLKEEHAAMEFSHEAVESAEVFWAQFLRTL